LNGHQARVAYEGSEAVQVARTFAPEIAFVDLSLPGFDGLEVARRIRESEPAPGMLLVALTGYGRDSDRQRSREAGFDDHLVKPVNPQDLLSLIHRGRF
jgi:CheY-like chemotaxis protein